MRIKLIKENFCHNKLLSLLIILCSTCVSILLLLSLEINNYLIYANIENNQYQYNDFDIRITANIPLSLRGTESYEENNQEYNLNEYYNNVISYYSTTLMVNGNNKNIISNIIEADEEDYFKGFDLKIIPKKNEAVITEIAANDLNIKINDEIFIHLKNSIYSYKVIDIINADIMYNGKFVLIGGRNLTYQYGLNNVKMQNNILLDLKNTKDAQIVTDKLIKNYSFCNVTNLLDKETASRQNINTIPSICIISAIVFILALLILCNIYSYRLRKQKEVFTNYRMLKYYTHIHLIEWFVIIVINLILSTLITTFVLSLFNPIFNVSNIYFLNIFNVCVANIFIIIIPIILYLKNIKFGKKVIINSKFKYILLVLLISICFICSRIFKYNSLKDLFIVCTVIFICILIVKIFIESGKFIRSLLNKSYLYDLNKNNTFLKLLLVVQISMMICMCLIISSITMYFNSVYTVHNFIKIDMIVATTSKIEISSEYDHIKVANNVVFGHNEIDYLLSLSSDQIKKYTEIDLSFAEKEQYDNNKSIILPEYYSNEYALNIGDTIELTINGEAEEFKIIKFLKGLAVGSIFVSASDNMYNAYIVDNSIPIENVIEDFNKTTYFIYDIESNILVLQDLHQRLIKVAVAILVFIMIILIIFSLYIFRLNFLHKKDTFIKFKQLGLTNKLWDKLSLIRTLLIILICSVIGIIIEYFLINRIDSILRIFKSILHANYQFVYSIISISIIIINAFIGFIYNKFEYKKL